MEDGRPAPLSEAQLEIMNVVWARGEVTVAEVWKGKGGPPQGGAEHRADLDGAAGGEGLAPLPG